LDGRGGGENARMRKSLLGSGCGGGRREGAGAEDQ
jgi:hypothetical protein